MALEQITFNIGAFNDSDAGGNNYFTNTVFEVKNQSDNTFATIYADSSGTTQIPQNGIDNVSNSRGECNFYIDDGDFYLEVDSQQKNFSIGNFKTDFSNIDEVKAYPKLSKLIGQRITTIEYHSGTGYGGASYDVVSSSSVTPNGIDIIQGVADSGAAITLKKSGSVDISQLGANYNSTIYTREQAYNILKLSGKDIQISGNWLLYQGVSQPSDTTVEFVGAGSVEITSSFYQVWGFEGGGSLEGRTLLINPVIDAKSFIGTNGIGIGGSGIGDVVNVSVLNPLVKNCIRDPLYSNTYNGGGRGFMIESNAYDINVSNPQAINCTSAFAFQCSEANPTDRVAVTNPMARDCMHYAEFFDLPDGGSDPYGGEMGGINISGGYAFNCGKALPEFYSGDGTFDNIRDTGVIIGERARHVTWHGFKIHNNNNYGIVGSVWRGTGFNVDISGTMIGNVISVYDGTTDSTLLPIGGESPPPSGLSVNSRGIFANVKLVGGSELVYRCLTPDSVTSGHQGHKIKVSISENPSIKLIEVPSPRGDAYVEIYNYNDGTFLNGAINQIVNSGNVMPSAGVEKRFFDELSISGTCNSNGLFRVTSTGEFISEANTTFDGSKTVRMQGLPATTGIQDRVVKSATLPSGYSYLIIKD